MLDLFNFQNRYTNEDLINELTDPFFYLEDVNKIYSKLQVDLNSLYINNEPLLIACCKKDLYNSVKWLLENRVNIEIENSLKESAIFYAIYSKDTKLLELLIDFGANINHLNNKNRTVLQEAIHNSNNKIVRFLINNTTQFTNIDKNGNNVLFDAVTNGNMNIIKKLVSLKRIDLNHKNFAGNTVLHLDNSLKNIELSTYLLNHGADPTIQNSSSVSYLFYVVTKGIEAINFIKRASDLGFNLNLKNSENKNILMVAVDYFLKVLNSDKRASQAELIKELVQQRISIQSTNNENETIFFNITRSLDRDLIHYLLNNLEKLNLNRQNINGITVLAILILSGIENYDLIKLYIEKGASLDYKNKNNQTIIEILIDIILHIDNNLPLDEVYKNEIIQNGHYKDVLEAIIKNYFVDINALNSRNEPLFFPALLSYNFSLFKILRTKLLSFNAKDIDENNILFRLIKQDIISKMDDRRVLLNTIRNLVNAGVDINDKNKDGLTALEFAMLNDKEDVVKLLLELRANSNILDEKGRTLIHRAIFKDKENFIKIFASYNRELLNKVDSFGTRPINYAAFMGKRKVVLEMLALGATINNPYKKSASILSFLKKYHKNILNLATNIENANDKYNLNKLAENMIVEFEIKT